MLDIYFQITFILIMSMAVIVFLGLLPLLIIQTQIFKKTLDPIYFNSNYFNEYELNIFDSFPLIFMKTLAYVRAIIFPQTMRKRFTLNILNRKDYPFLYLLALLTIIILIICTVILINTAISAAIFYSTN